MDVEFDGTTRIKAKLGALAVTIYMEKARKSHLARVVLMDITVVVTYSQGFS